MIEFIAKGVDNMELGKQVYELRKKANLSQEQLAERSVYRDKQFQNGSLVKLRLTLSKHKFYHRYLVSVWMN